MVNARVMYFRPENLFKEFIIEGNKQKVVSAGRVVNDFSGDGSRRLKGCLAEATEEERTRHSLPDHIVTHTIVQSGPPEAKRADRLILGNRVFYVVDIDEAGMFGIVTIYYAEEREGLKS